MFGPACSSLTGYLTPSGLCTSFVLMLFFSTVRTLSGLLSSLNFVLQCFLRPLSRLQSAFSNPRKRMIIHAFQRKRARVPLHGPPFSANPIAWLKLGAPSMVLLRTSVRSVVPYSVILSDVKDLMSARDACQSSLVVAFVGKYCCLDLTTGLLP